MRVGDAIFFLLLSCTASFAQQGSARRPNPAEAQVMAGPYDFTNEAGTRKCVLLFRPSDAPGGYAAGLLPQCRASMPILAKVSGWSVTLVHAEPRAQFTLRDAQGSVVIELGEAGPNGTAQGRDLTGQIYLLKPSQGATLVQRADSLVGIRPAPPPVAVRNVVPPPDPVEMRKSSGSFALIRRGDKDTGCRLSLEPYTPGEVEGRAVLAAGCDDKGLLYFAPKGWSASDATLWLLGTRGKIAFDRDKRGGWEKSPGQGEWLGLIRQ